MKVTANQSHRVTPSQSGSKERDEGFVAAHVDTRNSKHETDVRNVNNQKPNNSDRLAEDKSQHLIEQRKRALAEQLAEKDKAKEKIEQNEELSAQRKIESRAAANREKIKDSYDAVKHNNNHDRADKVSAEASKVDKSVNNKKNPDPINLVV